MYDYTTVTRERLHGYDKFLSETCTSTDDPGHLRNERVQLPSPCTTTSTTVARTSTSATAEYNYFHYRRENDYFPSEPIRPENARFKGITAENDRRGPNACVE